jgi:hypothetical protein
VTPRLSSSFRNLELEPAQRREPAITNVKVVVARFGALSQWPESFMLRYVSGVVIVVRRTVTFVACNLACFVAAFGGNVILSILSFRCLVTAGVDVHFVSCCESCRRLRNWLGM